MLYCHYTIANIERLRNNLELYLKDKKIETVDPLSYSESGISKDVVIDEDALTTSLQAIIVDEEGNPRDALISRDVKSLSSISRERKTVRRCGLDTCKSILITRNNALIQEARSLIIDRIKTKQEFPLAISDIDLTARLWLNSFNEQTSIAKTVLIASAYAACEPSQRIIENVSAEIDRIRSESTQHSSLEVFSMRQLYLFSSKVEERLDYMGVTCEDQIPAIVQDMLESPEERDYYKDLYEHAKADAKKANQAKENATQKMYDLARSNANNQRNKVEKRIRTWTKAGFIGLCLLVNLSYFELTLKDILSNSHQKWYYICAGFIILAFSVIGAILFFKGKFSAIEKAICVKCNSLEESYYQDQIKILKDEDFN